MFCEISWKIIFGRVKHTSLFRKDTKHNDAQQDYLNFDTQLNLINALLIVVMLSVIKSNIVAQTVMPNGKSHRKKFLKIVAPSIKL